MADKTERDIFRGERAQRLLEDELLQEAFATIEQEYIQQWLNSPERDIEGRERLRLMIKSVQRLQLELTSVLQTGQVAKEKLSLLEKARKIGQKLVQSS